MALIDWNQYNGAGLNKLEYFTIQLHLVSNRPCLHDSCGRWVNAFSLLFDDEKSEHHLCYSIIASLFSSKSS